MPPKSISLFLGYEQVTQQWAVNPQGKDYLRSDCTGISLWAEKVKQGFSRQQRIVAAIGQNESENPNRPSPCERNQDVPHCFLCHCLLSRCKVLIVTGFALWIVVCPQLLNSYVSWETQTWARPEKRSYFYKQNQRQQCPQAA